MRLEFGIEEILTRHFQAISHSFDLLRFLKFLKIFTLVFFWILGLHVARTVDDCIKHLSLYIALPLLFLLPTWEPPGLVDTDTELCVQGSLTAVCAV